jgi:ribose-phosphate pyrophosphokinase
MTSNNSTVLFAGTSHPQLAQQIAGCLGVSLGKAHIETFPDGEIGVRILESVRGQDVFVMQSIARHPNFYLMELLILMDALKRASARSINVVLPYFGYARQDRRGAMREPITAKLIADLLQQAGASRVVAMDLHTEQIQGFFNIPVDNLYARPVLVEAVEKLHLEDLIVVTPDIGSIKLARTYAASLKVELAIVDKSRMSAQEVQAASPVIGDVKGKNVLLVDDIFSTGRTLKMAALACEEAGAIDIYAAVTHGLCIGNGWQESAIEKMIVTNTVTAPEEIDEQKIHTVSVAPLFAMAIESIIGSKSISSYYG